MVARVAPQSTSLAEVNMCFSSSSHTYKPERWHSPELTHLINRTLVLCLPIDRLTPTITVKDSRWRYAICPAGGPIPTSRLLTRSPCGGPLPSHFIDVVCTKIPELLRFPNRSALTLELLT
jgi:hypothetical protein